MLHPEFDLPMTVTQHTPEEAVRQYKRLFRKANQKTVIAILIMLIVMLPVWLLTRRIEWLWSILNVAFTMGTAGKIILWHRRRCSNRNR